MTSNDAINIVYGPLDELRSLTHTLSLTFDQADNSTWIRQASRKQLLAEIIRLYANNHQGN
ncbi:MAG: hypothetical protein JO271_17540 [Verrucomicrobia bacterium]|nr:hypothetical protein [Verrucomicrobiota bacterium]MBV9273810.1 hypothetical protein [Verrucomicrobiota bacterium]